MNNMGDTFCLTVSGTSGKCISTFQAANGEEYTIQLHEDLSMMTNGTVNVDLTIRWDKRSSKFIRLSCYRRSDFRELDQRSLFVEDETCARFAFSKEVIANRRRMNLQSYNSIHWSNGALSDYVYVLNIASHVPLVDEVAVNTDAKPTNAKEPVRKENVGQLLLDMRNLFETGHLSDVVLTDGSEDIKAHKIILSTRCSFFARMFEHPVTENLENRVTVKDIAIDVLREMLRFLYTGTVVIKDSRMARDLYVASDKYGVKDLRDICSGELRSVDMSSVLDTLLLADLCHDKILKEAALLFIFKNYSDLKALDSWIDFMKEHQALALEVLSFVIDKK